MDKDFKRPKGKKLTKSKYNKIEEFKKNSGF